MKLLEIPVIGTVLQHGHYPSPVKVDQPPENRGLFLELNNSVSLSFVELVNNSLISIKTLCCSSIKLMQWTLEF